MVAKLDSPKLKLTPSQPASLEQRARRQAHPHRLVTRAKIIFALDAGTSPSQIARPLGRHRGTLIYWHHRWLEEAAKLLRPEAEPAKDRLLAAQLEAPLSDKPRAGRPPTFTAEQIGQLVAVACEPPAESQRPLSQWPPRELADAVEKRGLGATIAVPRVRRFLKSGGLAAPPRRAVLERQAR